MVKLKVNTYLKTYVIASDQPSASSQTKNKLLQSLHMADVNFKSTVRISLDISPSRYQANRHIAHEYFQFYKYQYIWHHT